MVQPAGGVGAERGGLMPVHLQARGGHGEAKRDVSGEQHPSRLRPRRAPRSGARREPMLGEACREDMNRFALVATMALAAALIAPATSVAGGWATVGLSSLPDRCHDPFQAGERSRLKQRRPQWSEAAGSAA